MLSLTSCIFPGFTFMRPTVPYTSASSALGTAGAYAPSSTPRYASSMAETRTGQGHGGVRLAVREWPGRGPSILLLHGLASSSHIWDLGAPRLAPRFHVVGYDQRGHGRSGKPSSGYGFDRLIADAAAVIGALGMGRPVVAGHSWGAHGGLPVA